VETLFGVGLGLLSEILAIKGTSDVIELTPKIKKLHRILEASSLYLAFFLQ